MKSLHTLLPPGATIRGNAEIGIQGLASDSRKVREGFAFIAVQGTLTDGHQYIGKAIGNGATAIICETLPKEAVDNVTYVQLEDSQKALGLLAAEFYGHPSKELGLVGVTGTNGKTTTVTLLYRLLMEMGYKAGLLSTIENRIGHASIPATHTTPDPISLNALLREMVDAGCDYAFMEVSSHAVVQERIAGLRFRGGVFSNLSHDHLDYHRNFDNYIKAKKKFFDDLGKDAFALVNVDDRRGNVMLQNTKAKPFRYALRRQADFKAKIMANSLMGLQLEVDGIEFFGKLVGMFNAYNYLAAYASSVLLGMDKMEVLAALSSLPAAEGRFDTVSPPGRGVTGIVDYAHTPDALENVLETIDDLKRADTQVITVVGCGGDRDKAKRPLMAEIACKWSQKVILTSDNPRSEVPEAIIQDMEKGVKMKCGHKVLNITDRKQAIKTACALARAGDIILVAGKGHEKYQEIKGEKLPFDDKEVLVGLLMSGIQNP